jgi:hypothetical protein
MTKEEREEIDSLKRMVKDASVTEEERKEKERIERIEKLEKTVADLASRVAALESKTM